MQTQPNTQVFPSGVVRTMTADGKLSWTFQDGTTTRKSPVDGWPETVSAAGGMVRREFPDGKGNYALFFRHDAADRIAAEFAVLVAHGPVETVKHTGKYASSAVTLAPAANAKAPSSQPKAVNAPAPHRDVSVPARAVSGAQENKEIEQIRTPKWCIYGGFNKAGRAAGVFSVKYVGKIALLPEDFDKDDHDFYAVGMKAEVIDVELQETEIKIAVKQLIRDGKLKVDWKVRDLVINWDKVSQ